MWQTYFGNRNVALWRCSNRNVANGEALAPGIAPGANGNADATARAGACPIDQVRAAVRIDASTASMRRVTRARIAAFEPTIASDDAMIR